MAGCVTAWIGLLVEGYRTGELAFEQYARLCRMVIHANTPDKPNVRNRLLGEAIANALGADRRNPGRGNKGAPQCIRAVALDLLEMVREREDLPLSRTPGNAFERCCELFAEGGFPGLSHSELERWRAMALKSRE